MPAGRPSRKTHHIDEVKRLYVDEKRSLSEISRDLKISVQTLSRWLTEDGVQIEHRPRNPNAGRSPEAQAEINARISATRRASEVKKPAAPPKTAAQAQGRCVSCGNEFTRRSAKQRYCSHACHMHQRETLTLPSRQAEWLQSDASLCPCGQSRIPYAARKTTKYCSSECRQEYGQKKQPDPAKQITFECQNCGASVTRPRTYGSFKYCSNDCARRHTETKKHFTVDDVTVLDSGYEVFFWGLCAVLKIPIRRYDRDEGIQWKEDTWYAPDFIIGIRGHEYPVEIKGLQDPDDEERWRLFREQRGQLVVIQQEELLRWTSGRAEVMGELVMLAR